MTSALLRMSDFLFLGLCYRYTCMGVSNLRNNYRKPLDNNIYKTEYIHMNLYHTCTQFKGTPVGPKRMYVYSTAIGMNIIIVVAVDTASI